MDFTRPCQTAKEKIQFSKKITIGSFRATLQNAQLIWCRITPARFHKKDFIRGGNLLAH